MNVRGRVVLVDDDPTIRRLFALALEDLDIDLQLCPSVAQARQVLREAPAQLLVTDLMMPGENGFDLLQALNDDPGLRAGARLAVFSAGLNAAVRDRLAIEAHFGNDTSMFASFRAGALAQLAADLAEGDRWRDGHDLAGLRRLGHSLKGVLLLLGHGAAADLARALEHHAAAGDAAASVPAWQALRGEVQRLTEGSATRPPDDFS